MRRHGLAAQIVLALMGALALAAPALARPGFAASRFAAYSVDARTGRVLYARNADARRYPASLTKVMTLYVTRDAIRGGKLKLDDKVTMSRHAAAQPPSKLGLRAGDSLTVREAMNVIVVKSANDVAVALAERVAGSEPAFVKRMNAEARRLGMTDTHFANASGLPNSRNYSTAHDLVILARAFIRDHPRGYALFDQQQTVFRGRVIPGHNHLLASPGVDGLKTGYINASGFNLLTSGVRHGRRVIAVVLGGSTARVRDRFMTSLLQTSFEKAAGGSEGASVQLASVDAPRPAASDRAHDDADDDGWWVQVGAFHDRDRGEARLAAVTSHHPARFPADAGEIQRDGDLFTARFSVHDAQAANDACEVIRRDGQDCLWMAAHD